MRRLGFLLRPGWLALVIGVIIFAGACFWVLSPWQFGRNTQRSALNSDITNAVSDPAVPLRQLLPVGVEPPATQAWREVTMAGHYLPADEIVARLRQVSDQPADEILTPFRTDDGRTMLVDRGWVSPNNGEVPNYAPAPSGHVTLTARMHPEESDPHRPPLTEQGHREIYSINTTVVSDLTGLAVDPGYFALVDNQPGVLNVLPLPQIDSGPFLSYALQWIVFGIMAHRYASQQASRCGVVLVQSLDVANPKSYRLSLVVEAGRRSKGSDKSLPCLATHHDRQNRRQNT